MRRKTSIIAGVMCGLGCALCVWTYGAQLTDQVAAERAEAIGRYGGEQLEVCVAQRTILEGETLDETAVQQRPWLVDLLPEGAVTDVHSLVGKRVSSTILEGEVLSDRRFTQSLKAFSVPPGKTALSVPAQAVQAVGGSLEAGMCVDVYATGVTTERILESVVILATGLSDSESTFSSSASTWLTLAVPPEAVQEIVAAAQNLELYFTLPGQEVGFE